jgi:peptidoglycan hydrolase CwlO-like protein
MNDVMITIGINALTLIVAILVFKNTLSKDKEEKETAMINRINDMEKDQRVIKDNIRSLANGVEKLTLAVDRIKDTLNDLNVNIVLVQDLKSTIKEFNQMLLGIDRVVTQHGVEIKNIRGEND